jgi:HK97 family phage major capsid protein
MALAPIDNLRRRFRDAATRRALDELRHDVARQIRQAAEDTDDDGMMSEGSQGLFDALKQLLTEIDAKVSRQTVLDDLDTRAARPRDRADRAFDASLYDFSVRGMIAAAIGSPIPGLDIARSMEISHELRNRPGRAFQGFPCPIEALSLRADYARKLETRQEITTVLPATGPGGNLIAQVLDASRYVDALRARTVVRQAGAQVISGVVGNLNIPRMKQFGQVQWFNEGDTILKTDESFDQVSFLPRHCGAISTYSRNLLLQATPDVEMIIRDDLSRLLALDMDRVALVGTGQGAEPLGIINNPACGTIAATVYAYQNQVDLRALLTGKNVPLESVGFIGNSQNDAWALSTLDAMARPLGKGLVYLGYPDYVSNVCTFAGLPAGTPVLPAAANPLICGAWSDMIITFWSELDILPNATADSVYSTGAVMVRALMTADVNLRHPESFSWANLAGPPVKPTA